MSFKGGEFSTGTMRNFQPELTFSFFEASEYIEGSPRWIIPVGLVEPSHFGQPPSLLACRSMVPGRTRS